MGQAAFPASGASAGSVLDELRSRKADDVDWRSGKTSLYVQFGGDDVYEVSRQAADLYFSENAHGAAAFPSVQRLQSEVIGHLLDLLNAGAQGDGCLTAAEARASSWR